MRFKKMNLSSILLLLIFSWFISPLESYSQVHILYTSSINGALMGCNCPGNPYGGIDRIIGTIKAFKKDNGDVLTIDSGDFFGTYPDEGRDNIIWSSLAGLPYDYLLPGDQEFIYGLEYFINRVPEFKGKILRGAINNNIPRSINEDILTFDEVKIAILGWHVDKSFSFINPEKVTWENETELIRNRIEKLKPDVNIIILVSHVGLEENSILVKAGVKPDIIICGHSQEKVEKKLDTVLLVQSGMEGETIGHLKIFRQGNKTKIENSFIPITKDSPIDMEIRESVKKLIFE